MSERYKIDSAVYKRATKYIARVPGAVQGQNGDKDTFKLICILSNGFLLDDEAVLSLLEPWNQICQPPWEIKELKRKIHEARKRKPPKGKQYGWMLGGSLPKQPRSDEGSQSSSDEQPSQTQSIPSKETTAKNSLENFKEASFLLFDRCFDEKPVQNWVRFKRPIVQFDVQEFHGQTAYYFPKPVTYPNWYHQVIVIPMFDMTCNITGYILHRADGEPFNKNGQRFMITPGSSGGIVCNPDQLALLYEDDCPITHLVRVEGVSDALALYSKMPEDCWQEYLIVSPGCGGNHGVDHPPFSDLLKRAAEKDIKVVGIGDNDRTGSRGADKWCCAAVSAGCQTWRSEIPDSHYGNKIKDVRDYLIVGGSWEEVIHNFALPWERNDARTRRPRLINPEEIEEREVNWLWSNKIPAGAISMFVGPQGLGKTFISVYMASVITRGGVWADGTSCEKGSVLFFYGEDDIQSVYKPRLRANGADQSKIRFLDGIEIFNNNAVVEEVLSIKCVDEIREAIHDTEKATGVPVRLVVIDPISNYWNGVKENDNAEVRAALKPIQRLAEETGAAFLLISHVGKTDRDSAVQRVLGSTALTAVARSVWVLYPHEEQKGHIYFAPSKNNLAVDPTSVEFHINREEDGRVDIVDAKIEKTADDFEAERRAGKKRGRSPVAAESAREWLKQFLSSGPKFAGSRDNSQSGSVYAEAVAAGHSVRTIDRVKKEIGVASRKREDGLSEWYISGCSISRKEIMKETVKSPSANGPREAKTAVVKNVRPQRKSASVPDHSGTLKRQVRQ